AVSPLWTIKRPYPCSRASISTYNSKKVALNSYRRKHHFLRYRMLHPWQSWLPSGCRDARMKKPDQMKGVKGNLNRRMAWITTRRGFRLVTMKTQVPVVATETQQLSEAQRY